MSNENQKTKPVTVIDPASPAASENVQKPNFLARSRQFVKDHKRPAIAVGALVGLVGLAAVVGRKTEVKHEFNATLELESASQDEPVEETADTHVA